MTVLSDVSITSQIEQGWITVLPFDPELVQPASLDIRLGSEFLNCTTNHVTSVDPFDEQPRLMTPGELVDDVFILHPGQFALGVTLEFIGMPDNLVGRVEGKSSLGRLGIQVHSTAGFIDPGFSGQITLELTNLLDVPVLLTPGMTVGQICFMQLDHRAGQPYGAATRQSKYGGQRGPQPSQYWKNSRPVLHVTKPPLG